MDQIWIYEGQTLHSMEAEMGGVGWSTRTAVRSWHGPRLGLIYRPCCGSGPNSTASIHAHGGHDLAKLAGRTGANPAFDGGDERTAIQRRQNHRFSILLGAALVLIVASLVVIWRERSSQNTLANYRPSGIPANISTSTATLMSLSPIPHNLAPSFSLVDQFGKPVTLKSLRGRVVVLEFMDPHCTDICPIVSQEYIDAYHDLGKSASKAAFVAVNVNQYFNSPSDMLTFSNAHGLNSIPSWKFMTGGVTALQTVWKEYGVQVEAPNPKADIIHSSVVYFIGPNGKESYFAAPADDHTKSGAAFLPASQLAAWGNGIATIVRDMSK